MHSIQVPAREIEPEDTIVAKNRVDLGEVVWADVQPSGVTVLIGTETGEYLREFKCDEIVEVVR